MAPNEFMAKWKKATGCETLEDMVRHLVSEYESRCDSLKDAYIFGHDPEIGRCDEECVVAMDTLLELVSDLKGAYGIKENDV